MGDFLLRVENIVKHFPLKTGFFGGQSGIVHAVDNVSLTLNVGETLGLVGESGCGKTTLARLIARLDEPTAGKLFFRGKDISSLSGRELKPYWREVQMVFQDPFESLNPRRRVESILGQPFLNFNLASGSDLRVNIVRLLDMVGLKPGEMYLARYPHQFSGGQRQRIGIARAIALGPQLIIADEPVSALDISVRAQILNLMMELQRKNRFSCLFISHDLGVIRSICNVVAVMYLGKIVERGETENIFSDPLHPYTIALLSATPLSDPLKARTKKRRIIKGDVPSAVNPPTGCRFKTRCSFQGAGCSEEEPPLQEHSIGHWAACHRAGEMG
jgi:oligopeptide/dipeptide ABC transporter ATP-binding protein